MPTSSKRLLTLKNRMEKVRMLGKNEGLLVCMGNQNDDAGNNIIISRALCLKSNIFQSLLVWKII